MIRVIYAGDARDIVKRIRSDHCRGNVEASALRKHIAEYRRYPIKKTRRTSGSYRVRLDLPDPKAGEQNISAYLRCGVWKYVLCDSYEEAKDFQWYVIDALNPLLNVQHKPWNRDNLARYQTLLAELTSATARNYEQLRNTASGPGVYVLFHEATP